MKEKAKSLETIGNCRDGSKSGWVALFVCRFLVEPDLLDYCRAGYWLRVSETSGHDQWRGQLRSPICFPICASSLAVGPHPAPTKRVDNCSI